MSDKLTAKTVRELVIEIIGFMPWGYGVSRQRGLNAWALVNKAKGIDLGNDEKSIRRKLKKVVTTINPSPTIAVEAIDMRARRFGYFPRTFVWRGVERQVESVKHCWPTNARIAKMNRHYFKVVCADGEYTLFQDLRHKTWHIQV